MHAQGSHDTRNPRPVLSTTGYPEKNAHMLGLVKGNIAMSRNVVKDLLGGLKSMVGGEVDIWTDLLDEARSKAEQRMLDEATNLGADAVIGVRFSTGFAEDVVEAFAYGTAVTWQNPAA